MSAARLPLSAVFFSLLFSGILLPVFAEPSSASPPPAADPAAAFAAALEQAGDQDVSGAFADALRAFPEGEDRRQLLVWFADYEERSSRFDRAAEYYTLAAETPPVDFPLYLATMLQGLMRLLSIDTEYIGPPSEQHRWRVFSSLIHRNRII